MKHGFTSILSESIEKPLCVLCFQILLNELLKENKLKRHLRLCHPYLIETNLDFFQQKENALKKQRFDNQVKMNVFSVKRKPLLHLTLFRIYLESRRQLTLLVKH